MKKKLSELIDLKSGYTFRQPRFMIGSGPVRVLQASDIANSASKEQLYCESIGSEHYLLKGDVLLSNRGRFVAKSFESQQPTVASSSVFVLRPKDKAINPTFLAAYLNQNNIQIKLKSLSTGSSMRTISKNDIEGLEINVPEREAQNALAGLYDTVKVYKESLQHKYTLMDQIFTASTSQLIEKGRQ